MPRTFAVVLVLLAALAAAWFLGGKDLFTDGGGGERAGGGGAVDPASAPGHREGEGAEATEARAGGPVLFGRGASDRPGLGHVTGRVMDFRTGKPVAGARVFLAGTGRRGESVQLRGATSDGGTFSFPAVAAGPAHALRVEADGLPARTLPALVVEADAVEDVGTVWLGKRAALEGVVVDVDDRGVRGAVVRVFPSGGSLMEMMGDFMELIGTLDQEPVPLARAETDGDGKFRVEELAPGPVALLVHAPGHALTGHEAAMTSDGPAGGPVRIVLQRGQVVAGKVVDGSGAAVPAARIAVVGGNDPESFLYGRVFTETARDGSFRIDTLAGGGDLSAIVAARGFPTTFAELAVGDTDARIVLQRSVRVTVRILSKAGDAPVEDAAVAVAVGDAAELTDHPGTMVYGRTDARGLVELAARPGKVQMVMVTHPELSMNLWMPQMAQMMPMGMEGPKDPTIPDTGADFTFRVAAGLRVTGRVTGPEGEPVAGAKVSSIGMGGMQQPVLTDAEGRYVMVAPTITESAATVMVRAVGYVQEPASMAARGGDVAPGTREVVHDVVLQRAAVVTGRVLSKDGTPLPGAAVVLRGGDGGGGMDAGFAMLFGGSTATSAEDGSYLLDTARPTKAARVVAQLEGHVNSSTEPFDVPAGGSVRAPDLVMRRGAGLEVRVVDPNGAPAPGARVEVKHDASNEIATDLFASMRGEADVLTDASGVAHVKHLAAGKVTLTATRAGSAAARATVEIPADDQASVAAEVRLRRGGTVSGTVLDAEGKPVAGARITAWNPAGDGDQWMPHRTARTDAEGRFRVEDLPLVAFTLSVERAGFTAAKVPLEAPREDVSVRLTPADPDVIRRRLEITTQMSKIYEEMQAAKDDAERKALQQRIQDLMAELGDLPGED
jgi:protocatechuate 3,4-dioxygenase beta subunit